MKMMMWRKTAMALLAATTIGSAAACAPYAGGRLYVRVGPPAPHYEARIVSPGAGYVWVDGYQRWDGRGYAWVPGRWVRPPSPRSRWVQGRWVHDRQGWYYAEGHWR
jgi:hypothetical protein